MIFSPGGGTFAYRPSVTSTIRFRLYRTLMPLRRAPWLPIPALSLALSVAAWSVGCSGSGGSRTADAGTAGDSARVRSVPPETADDAVRKMAAGEYEAAIAILGRLIDRDTTSPGLYDLMGQCMAELGYCGQAGNFFRKGLQVDSSNVSLLTHAAQAAASCGYAGEARDHYTALSRLRPFDMKTLLSLARLSIQESDYDGAIAVLGRAVEVDSTSVVAHYLMGSSLAAQKKIPEAIAELNLALWCQPGYIPAIRDLAWLYYQSELYGEATTMYKQGVDLQPSSVPFRIGLANCHFKRMQYDEALPLYRNAETEPFRVTSIYQQGLCYYYLGKYDTAKIHLNRALAIDTANIGAHYNLGLTLLNLGEYPAAIRSFENAIRLSRSDIIASSYDRIGVAHYELKRKNAALAAFRKAIDENPRNARAYYDMGVLYENLGDDRAKALECYRSVISIEKPSDAETSLYFKARERLRLLGGTKSE